VASEAAAGIVAPAGRVAPDRHWLSAERVRVYSWLIVIIFGIAVAVWTALALPDLVDPRGKPLGYDFIAFWSAARLAIEGRPEAAYDWAEIAAAHRVAVPAMKHLVFAWHYPPTFLLTVWPLGLLSYPVALAVFVVATAGLWAGLVRRVVADKRAWIVAAAAPAGLVNLLGGQNGFLTAGLAGFALLLLARRPVAAGVLIGLLAIKPHLAVLFPLALLAERQWRAIAAAAVTVGLFAGASIAAFGWDTAAAFLHDLPLGRALIDGAELPWGSMPSGYVFALSLGIGTSGAAVLQGIAALLAATCVYRVWRRRGAAREAKAATLLAGSLLISPFLFNYDLTWAALAVGWLALLGMRAGFARGEREVLLLAWLVPMAMAPIYAASSVQLGFPALVLLLLVAVRRAAPLADAERRRLGEALDLLREARWLTRERVMRWGAVFAVVAVGVLVFWFVSHTARGLTNEAGEQLGVDFVNYFAGAQLAAGGFARLAYDVPWFHAFEQTITGPGSEFKFYGYPPIAMVLTLPLALLSFVPALILWLVAGTAICFLLLRRLVGWRAAAVAVIGTPPAFDNLLSGQNGCFTATLLAGGLMAIDRRPILAGICFGCLAYKPQLALLLPVALAAGGRWRAFAAAGITAAVLAIASLALFGGATWLGFSDQMTLQRRLLEQAHSFWHRMPTVFAAARMAGAPIAFAYGAQLASCGAAIVAVVAVWRSPASTELKAAGLTVAAFLATPYAWDYDMVVLIFAAAWLAREGLRTGFLAWERVAVVALLALPLPAMLTAAATGVQLGPVVLWAALLLLVRRSLGRHPVPAGAIAPIAARCESVAV
jgi:hypothetical protein